MVTCLVICRDKDVALGQPPSIRRDLGSVKLQLQTTIKSHPQTRFFACTRWIRRFLLVGHRGKPLFIRLYCSSITSACEVYLGNMGLDFRTPNQVDVENWCLFGAGLFFAVLCFVWLPFSRHEAECQRHDETKRQVQALEHQIADDAPKVKIDGHMQTYIKTDVFGLAVVIEAVNTGRKPAKI